MSERLDLFTTPILKVRPPVEAIPPAALAEAIARERATDPGIQRSNIGGWHSDTDMTDWGGEAARALATFATTQVAEHMKDIAAGRKRQFDWAIEMWANVNQPGSANQLHCHPGSFWSAVYYVDAGGAEAEGHGGELILEDPRYPLAYMSVPDLVLRYRDRSPMYSQFALRPDTGLMVVFPSWLRHSVRPHGGDRERISIAINLILVPASGGAPG